MDRRSLDLITTFVVLLATVFAAGGWLVLGDAIGLGAAIGGALAIVNWLAMRWVLARISSAAPGSNKGELVGLLVVKMLVLMTVLGVLVLKAHLSPLGLGLGLGALVVGLVTGGMISAQRVATTEQSLTSLPREES